MSNPTPIKLITVYPQDIIPHTKYMHDAEGRHDLLGQIFVSGYGRRIPPKMRTPQEMQSTIYPFTVQVRTHTKCNTCLTLQLLENARMPALQQIEAANKLLLPYNIQLVIGT